MNEFPNAFEFSTLLQNYKQDQQKIRIDFFLSKLHNEMLEFWTYYPTTEYLWFCSCPIQIQDNKIGDILCCFSQDLDKIINILTNKHYLVKFLNNELGSWVGIKSNIIEK